MALREIRGAIVVQTFGQELEESVLVDEADRPSAENAVRILRRLVEIGRERSDRRTVEVSVELLEDMIVEPLERIFPPDA